MILGKLILDVLSICQSNDLCDSFSLSHLMFFCSYYLKTAEHRGQKLKCPPCVCHSSKYLSYFFVAKIKKQSIPGVYMFLPFPDVDAFYGTRHLNA